MARKKKKFAINPLFIKVFFIGILILGIGFGIFLGIKSFMTHSPYFKVKSVTLDPALSFIDSREVSRIKGENIFSVDLAAVKRRLEYKYPQVDNLKVIKNFPDQISVVAEKRMPVAQADFDNRILTLDSKGIVLSTRSKREKKLPLIKGFSSKKTKYYLGRQFKAPEIRVALKMVNVFNEIKSLLAYKIATIDVQSLSKIDILLDNDLKVIMDKDWVDRKMEVLGFILSEGHVDLDEVKYIDLRFKEPIIGKKQ